MMFIFGGPPLIWERGGWSAEDELRVPVVAVSNRDTKFIFTRTPMLGGWAGRPEDEHHVPVGDLALPPSGFEVAVFALKIMGGLAARAWAVAIFR